MSETKFLFDKNEKPEQKQSINTVLPSIDNLVAEIEEFQSAYYFCHPLKMSKNGLFADIDDSVGSNSTILSQEKIIEDQDVIDSIQKRIKSVYTNEVSILEMVFSGYACLLAIDVTPNTSLVVGVLAGNDGLVMFDVAKKTSNNLYVIQSDYPFRLSKNVEFSAILTNAYKRIVQEVLSSEKPE